MGRTLGSNLWLGFTNRSLPFVKPKQPTGPGPSSLVGPRGPNCHRCYLEHLRFNRHFYCNIQRTVGLGGALGQA
jgi:hypothetical protein